MRIISFGAALFLVSSYAAPVHAQTVNITVNTSTVDIAYYTNVQLDGPGGATLAFHDPYTAFLLGDQAGAFAAVIAHASLPTTTSVIDIVETATGSTTTTDETVDKGDAVYGTDYIGDPDDYATWIAIGSNDVNVFVDVVTTRLFYYSLQGTIDPTSVTPPPPPPTPSTEAIAAFLETRIDLLLGNTPEADRRIARLGGRNASAQAPGAALMAFVSTVAQGNPGPVTASLAAIEAMNGDAGPSPLDIWFEGTFALFDNSGLHGHFSTASLGVDYLVTPDLLVGGFIALDRLDQFDTASADRLSGTGFLAGPYATARLVDNVYLDLLAAAGTASNTIDTGLGFVDEYGSTRWLVDATLSGSFTSGAWTFVPRLGIGYAEETSQAYTDGAGTPVPSVTSGLGQVSLGPGIMHSSTLDGIGQTVSLRLDAVSRFGAIDDVSARAEARVDWAFPGGFRFGATAAYSGIGSSHQNAGISLRASGSF